MRQNYFNFTPEFKLFMGGNDKPSLRSVNDAIRRRFVLIPFLGKFLGKDKDESLDDKLRTELGGILQWIMDGCTEWQVHGLLPPAIVTDATELYIAGEDALAQFLELKCKTDSRKRVSKKVLWDVWCSWAAGAGEEIGTRHDFAQNMENAGHAIIRSGSERLFHGIRLLESGEKTGQQRLEETNERF